MSLIYILLTQYIELNPVRAGLVEEPWQYPWSSAAAHLAGCADRLVRVRPLLEIFGNWREYLARDIPEEEFQALQRHKRTGRPLGDETFLPISKKHWDGFCGQARAGLKKDPGGKR